MKKGFKLASILLASTLLMAGCAGGGESNSNSQTDSSERAAYHLVSFYLDETTLYKTARVKDGEAIGETAITNPTKDGYTFVAWTTKDAKTFNLATDKVTGDLNLYAKFEANATPTPDPDTPSDQLNVDDTKDDSKNYYLVVGWWANTEKSGLTDDITRHFYTNLNVYLTYKGATAEQLKLVSFRKFSQSTVASMGEAINAQGDVDILIGVGNNINSTAGVTIKEKLGGISMGGQSRYIARVTDDDVAKMVYEFMTTETGKRLYDTTYNLTETDIAAEETPVENQLNVDDTKDDSKNYYLVVGWYAKTSTTGLTDAITRHFYSNLNVYLKYKGATSEQLGLVSFRKLAESGDVKALGEAINAQGDIDILIGVGNNIDSTTKGAGVTVKEKLGGISMGGLSRYIARVTDDDVAKMVYEFMTTATGKRLYDTAYTLTEEDITAEENSSTSSDTTSSSNQ